MWISAEISSWRKLAPQLPQSAVLSSSEQSDVPHPSGKTRLLHSNPAPACCSGAPGWLLWELYIANHWSYFLIWFSLMWSKSVWLCSCCGWWLVCWFYLHFWHSRCVCLGSCSTQELRGLRAIPRQERGGREKGGTTLGTSVCDFIALKFTFKISCKGDVSSRSKQLIILILQRSERLRWY